MEPAHKFYVAGVRYHELHRCIDEINEGDTLNLIPEPENKFDPNAVRIEFLSPKDKETFMLGYVPAKFSASVAAILDAVEDVRCVVTKVSPKSDPWERLEVAIYEGGDEDA